MRCRLLRAALVAPEAGEGLDQSLEHPLVDLTLLRRPSVSRAMIVLFLTALLMGGTSIFAAFSAEESGLIGSAQFVSHPPVPLNQIGSMLNLDMVGRLKGDKLYVGGTGTAAEVLQQMPTTEDEDDN